MTLILRDKASLRAWRAKLTEGTRLGFVPTMGALHAGHMSLVAQARAAADIVIASIFVNPLQFGPNEDLSRYPRPIEADIEKLEAAGVDALFLPSVEDMYPTGASTMVEETLVSGPLCGAVRPGHFRGVTTVVLKLFNLVQPHVAVFGQKDAQQCAVIERMVRDLDVPVEILRGPIMREADGLALSSRNVYLSVEDRAAAPLLHQSLQTVAAAYEAGERDAEKLAQIGLDVLAQSDRIKVQYWEVRDPESLGGIARVGASGALLAVAAHLGTTRLIDNLLLGGDV
ncbi:pantoate--beta-alanine ligase [Devosia subaequoris]|uniref:Pantothenate synthetase n=1 Tax=Devosia subaequoris TaxID=395930 RepID=A0A7W6NC86_9HYPH|nr:pantoate--beta-alanine ligase [Devosia subaequoris]MBB4053364.1 pantoate--beta-alanine ligase [Devosia subaequoris]MCP1210742.1 pantoate--beta-alanine ligase [Devosia subaequoris]